MNSSAMTYVQSRYITCTILDTYRISTVCISKPANIIPTMLAIVLEWIEDRQSQMRGPVLAQKVLPAPILARFGMAPSCS